MRWFAVLAFVLLVPACNASAEVADSSANGFTIKVTTHIGAETDVVYNKLIHNIGDWWDSSHTYSGNSHNLSIDDHAPGCWCEKLPDGGTVRHMDVVLVKPVQMIRLSGGLGPLQSMAATGSMTFQFSPAKGGTKVELTYTVGGYLPAGMNTLAAPVDSVLTDALKRFSNYVEHGNPLPQPQEEKPK